MPVVTRFTLVTLIVAALACGNSTGPTKNCKKGKPCGRTCIAKTDTCHL